MYLQRTALVCVTVDRLLMSPAPAPSSVKWVMYQSALQIGGLLN